MIFKRLVSIWKRHSLMAWPELLVKNVLYYGKQICVPKSREEASVFDRRLGAETDQICEIGALDIDSDNARHAVRYQPSPHVLAERLINQLALDFGQFQFVDFGAGKGRVLLIAAQQPFSAVIGVEFSAELCEIAKQNIAKLAQRQAQRLLCLHEDASLFVQRLPSAPLVCYFYNPFGLAVMRPVVEALQQHPFEVYVIYVDPRLQDLFTSTYWHCCDQGEFHRIYHRQANLMG